MAKIQLAESFGLETAPPPLIDAVAYQTLLEKLLQDGEGYGKTAPVAAYLLTSLKLVTRMPETNRLEEQEIEFKPLYVVMDIKKIPTEYGRLAMMEDITLSYARRMIGAGDLNSADYLGPEIWTAKKSSFDFDYVRSEGLNEQGKPSNIYNPNPDAFRVCLNVTEAVTIPTQWGEPWTIPADGTLAVRESDVAELTEALQQVRKGLKTAQEALYKSDSPSTAKFDVYGMMPNFLCENYNRVALKPVTVQKMQSLSAKTQKPRNSQQP